MQLRQDSAINSKPLPWVSDIPHSAIPFAPLLVGTFLRSASAISVLSPDVWNVWPRLAAPGCVCGRRLAGVWDVWASGRLGVWDTSGSRLVHVRARLERLGLYHVRTTSGH
eukprot:7384308-Prymnesium_polylepis.1